MIQSDNKKTIQVTVANEGQLESEGRQSEYLQNTEEDKLKCVLQAFKIYSLSWETNRLCWLQLTISL